MEAGYFVVYGITLESTGRAFNRITNTLTIKAKLARALVK
jgi:hypothetical protein